MRIRDDIENYDRNPLLVNQECPSIFQLDTPENPSPEGYRETI